MHQTRPPQQGSPQQHLQHPQGPYLPSQNSASNQSPYGTSSTPTGIYPSPHASVSSLPPQQSAYTSQSSTPRQVPDNFAFFPPQQGPYSANSTAGTFPTSHTPDMMAAPTTMRPSMPAAMYATPPSNSPASAHSPHEAHARAIYGPQAQNLYYPTYQNHPQPQYMHQPMTTQQPMQSHYQRSPQIQLQTSNPHMTGMDSARNRFDYTGNQRPRSHMGPPPLVSSTQPLSATSLQPASATSTPSTQNAAPGPIPATTPLVVKKGEDGVAWLKFEYSRDRIKNMYEIRCDIEKVDVKGLPADFKENNCVYPRACNSKEPYKGNRLNYETECNEVGWGLSWLNQELRGKRGLIQRAVDSWRNSATDPKLRSRRVRRMNKHLKRAQNLGNANIPGAAAYSNHAMAANKAQVPLRPEDLHHHRINSQRPNGANNILSTSTDGFQDLSQRTQTMLPSTHVKSDLSSESRQMGSVFPTYPLKSDATAVPMSPLHALDQYGARSAPGANAVAASFNGGAAAVDEDKLFGRMSNGPAEKFRVYSDIEQGAVKITRMLTKDPTAINNSWKEKYSVFPGSTDDNYLDFNDDMNQDLPSTGRTTVPVRLLDGWGVDMEIPNPSMPRRSRERYLNELGYRMSWGRNTEFCDAHVNPQKPRKVYLQRALDFYCSKNGETLRERNEKVPAHFERRLGKSKWQSARQRRTMNADSD